MGDAILYLSSTFPKLSETFVYREVLALRALGIAVRTASVHPPAADAADEPLATLARETTTIYDGAAVLRDALLSLFARPHRALPTLVRALRDATFTRGAPLLRRAKILAQAVAALALAHRFRDAELRHIHAHFAHVPATIAMYAARMLRIPFSFTGHANDLFQQRTLLPEKLRRCAFVACISHWHRAYYQGFAADLAAERAPIVRCGVDLPAIMPRAADAPDATDTAPRIVAVGRLVPKKGFDTLLHALANVRANYACDLIGDGPQREELERVIANQNLAPRVRLRGAMPHREILAALQNADLFVLPCRPDSAGDRDGIPVALMEAMAAGVPVIAGDLPAIRELVRDRDTGVIVPPAEIDALTTTLQTLLTDVELRAMLALRGRAWVAAEFSTDVNIRRLVAAFEAAGAPLAGAAPRSTPSVAAGDS